MIMEEARDGGRDDLWNSSSDACCAGRADSCVGAGQGRRDVARERGYAPDVTYPMGVQIVDGVDQARKAVREQIAHGADWIKVYADRSYFVAKDGTLSSTPTFNAEERKVIVEEALRLRHKVAADAMARPGIENALNAGVDSIEHGIAIPDDLLD